MKYIYRCKLHPSIAQGPLSTRTVDSEIQNFHSGLTFFLAHMRLFSNCMCCGGLQPASMERLMFFRNQGRHCLELLDAHEIKQEGMDL